ncbi:hypothetical protein M422DRAFT_272682 [Sphaerobolus stellatus SS14]|uniref:CCHC-type domain-containing protein n=1 Tax=Sphaerobolus stellatus (strain SS14) TaxID=990650 RepID=A0A0C9ULF2_SPHS4|nr:hypothetical protein M422DRAFT_272682 [Sphaerobolus stellatus SS14]
MAPKKRTVDKVPAGTGDATDSGSTPDVIGGNDPTMGPGKDPSKTASAASEANIIRPMARNTNPNPYDRSGDPRLPKTNSDHAEPSERSASVDPDPEELALGDQIQEMLDTINEHMDEERPSNWSNVDEESTTGQNNIDPELIQSTDGPNNRSNHKQVLGRARTELLAKTAVLERLYADQAPADHLNQAATAARSTRMEYERLLRLSKAGLLNPQDRNQSIQTSENTREPEIRDKTRKSVQHAPFDGIEDNDTDSETTVRNHREGSVPFQQPDDRDILDMSNNESDNALVRMVRYMLDQYIQTTMEKSPLAKAGVKVTPPDKYSGEQSFKALETFVKGLLRWLDMHSMLGPDAYRYQVLFLGTRLEGKALERFDKTVEPRKYQGTPMDLEQVVTGLYGQYIPSLARREASNKFDFIKQGTLSYDLMYIHFVRRYDPEKKTIHKLYLKVVKLEDSNRYDIGVRNSEPMTSTSRRDDGLSFNARRKPRINGLDRTKHHADPTKSGEINKGPAITPGFSGVNRNSSNTPGGAGPPIINRQQTNHDSSHNSIECYNCGKSGHIKPNCPEPLRACRVGAVHIGDSPTEQVDNNDQDINDPIDDERPTEDEYRNEDYDNQLDLSEDQRSWGSKPSEFDWSDDDQPC